MVIICLAIVYVLFMIMIITLCYYLGYMVGKRRGEEQALIDRLSEQGTIDRLADTFKIINDSLFTYDKVKNELERIKQGE